MSTLPITPELRAEATAILRESWDANYAAMLRIHHSGVAWNECTPRDERAREALIDVQAELLADLTRTASMDASARRLAKRVGLTVGATAPSWRRVGGAWLLEVWNAAGRDGWQSLPSTITDPAESMRAELAYTEPKCQ